MTDKDKNLTGVRVLAALNGLELFGHERANIEVFKTLRDLGAEVMVGVNARPDNHVKDELSRLGYTTFSLPFGPQWSIQWVRKHPSIAFTNFMAVFRCSLEFYKKIRQFRPTHIHLGSPLAYSYLSLALLASRVPLVYRMGDCPPTDSPFNLRIWRMAIRRASHVVSNSDYVRESAVNSGAWNVSVIRNFAPVPAGASPGDLNLPPQDRQSTLVYVGAVSEHKGLIPLAEAFSRVVSDYPSLRLHIVGGSRYDAPFRSELTQLLRSRGVEDKVQLHGRVGDPSDFYRRAAIHVAPSIWEEPAANVVLEAKREGTPSVVFPSGGLPEMVRHQVDGYICRDKSVDALEEGLRWMLADADRLARMGAAALKDSESRFGRERFAREWTNIYRGN